MTAPKDAFLAFETMILGLGLFFVGMQYVGISLRSMTGPAFRDWMRRSTKYPVGSALLGVLAGALMQSATAVTFITANMRKAGLVELPAAQRVILWCNVGLTAMAFLATLPLHPIVSLIVGLSGVAAGMLRGGQYRQTANLILGVGLILFGLQTMSMGAAPMKEQPWFQSAIEMMSSYDILAFAAGLLAAAILQSNAGAAMLIITLAATGSITVAQAAPMIYGTNLGAIFLRFLLSANLDRGSQRLVRFEDLFVLWSGILMMLLLQVEAAGVPLVLHLASHFGPGPDEQVALIFLLSNLIPAATLMPLREKVGAMLEKWLPDTAEELAGRPKYLNETALRDPSTAIDLLGREILRLLQNADDPARQQGFDELAAAIDDFGRRLNEKIMDRPTSTRLQRWYLVKQLIRFFRESCAEFSSVTSAVPDEPGSAEIPRLLRQAVAEAIDAAERGDLKALSQTIDATRRSGALHKEAKTAASKNPKLADQLAEFQVTLAMLHRTLKFLAEAL